MLIRFWAVMLLIGRVVKENKSLASHADELIRIREHRDKVHHDRMARPYHGSEAGARKRCPLRVRHSTPERGVSSEALTVKRQKAMGIPDPRSFSEPPPDVPAMIVMDYGIVMDDEQWNQFHEHAETGKPIPPLIEERMNQAQAERAWHKDC